MTEASKPIALVGMMGAGKTTAGRLLAGRLGVAFLDIDAEIERRSGKTIHEIFSEAGEQAFRDMERDMLARALKQKAGVVATGGGAFADSPARTLLLQRFVTVWLKGDLGVMYERAGQEGGRPLLGTFEDFEKLYQKRHAFYTQANLTVEITGLTPQEVAEGIFQRVKG